VQETPTPAPRRGRRKTQLELPVEAAPSGNEETPPAAEAATEVDASVELAQRIRERARQDLEFDVDDDEDPESIVSRIFDYTAQQRADAEELAAWRRQNEPFVGYGQQYLAQQKPQPEQTEKSEQPKPWELPVKYSENFAEYRERDEDGNETWKATTPADIRAQGDSWLAYQQQHVRMIANRPDLFWQKVREVAQAVSRDEVVPFYEQRTAEQQRIDAEQQFAEQNAAWLYARDPRENKPIVGQFSQIGQAFVQTYNDLVARGHSVQEAIEFAQYRVGKQTGAEPWKPVEKTPAQVREEKRKEHARKPAGGANAVANRSGSFTEGQPQNAQQGLGRSILAKVHQMGVSPPA